VLRIAQPPPPERPGAVPGHWKYWRREELLYTSGLLVDLPGDFQPPRCFATEERPDGRVWLWQEDLGALRERWEPARLVAAARHLGQFHGVYFERGGRRPLPQEAWLSQSWLPQWMERVASFPRSVGPLLARAEVWEQPLIGELFPPALRAHAAGLWEDRQALLDGLDRLPRTLCHNDAWPGNLFDMPRAAGTPVGAGDAGPRTAAIDWEFAGPGGIGTDLGQFLYGCQSGFFLDMGSLEAYRDFKERVLASYLDGVREMANVPAADDALLERWVRFGCAARAALQWGWLGVAWVAGPLINPAAAAEREGRRGQSIEEMSRRRALAVAFANDLGNEARSLLSTI
jgi:hypothetical protein